MPKQALTSSLLIAVALMAGCAATVQRPDPASSAPAMNIPAESAKRIVLSVQLDPRHPQDADWQSFRKEWIDITNEEALAQGFQFVAQDGEPMPTGEAGTLLAVRVNDYRNVGIGARVFAGIMTGNAFIDAKVEFRDLKTGSVYGERSYNTSSSAWHGVFAAMTSRQLYAIADETLAEIKRH